MRVAPTQALRTFAALWAAVVTLSLTAAMGCTTGAIESMSASQAATGWCVDSPKRPDVRVSPDLESQWRIATCISGRWSDEELCASSEYPSHAKKLCASDYEAAWTAPGSDKASILASIRLALNALPGDLEFVRATRTYVRLYPLTVGAVAVHRLDPVSSAIVASDKCERDAAGVLSCTYDDVDSLAAFRGHPVTVEGAATPNYNCHGFAFSETIDDVPRVWIEGGAAVLSQFTRHEVYETDPWLLDDTGSFEKRMLQRFLDDLSAPLAHHDVLAFYTDARFDDGCDADGYRLLHTALVDKSSGNIEIVSKLTEGPLVRHDIGGVVGLMRKFGTRIVHYTPPPSPKNELPH